MVSDEFLLFSFLGIFQAFKLQILKYSIYFLKKGKSLKTRRTESFSFSEDICINIDMIRLIPGSQIMQLSLKGKITENVFFMLIVPLVHCFCRPQRIRRLLACVSAVFCLLSHEDFKHTKAEIITQRAHVTPIQLQLESLFMLASH